MDIQSYSDTSESIFSVSDNMEELNDSRIAMLGFKPQKETPFNRLLPYSDFLDEESQSMLKEIKGNLGRCVLLKEIKPGCLVWTKRFQRYIQMFGLKFSKEDHITFIKLIYEVLTIPKLEPSVVSYLAVCLTYLLRKKELISREELTIPWRPLFDVIHNLTATSNFSLGMFRYSPDVETSLSELVAVARVYFEPSATQEILDQFRPDLCPFESNMIQGTVELLDMFLPTVFLPHETGLGHELWFNEFMELWTTCHNSSNWEPSMMNLMSRVASHNVGSIDWEPHLPLMYTRILRSFSLPVNYKKMKINKNHKLSMNSVSVWIVSTLGNGSSSQMHLSRMMKVLESYFHPANTGVWVARLREFLKKLPVFFIQRLNHERFRKKSWIPQIPEHARLTEEDVTRFVESMAPTVSLAMYSRVVSEISLSLQHLATMRPALVIPPIVESMYNTLGSLTEPHKYTAAMLSLVSIARPMIEPNEYKEGPTHVIPLLMAILPGIDPNDVRKCFITFQVITTFASLIPIVDSSNASEYWKDLTEEEEVVCAATSQLEDFVLEFLDRCFSLVDNSVLENTRLEQTENHKQQRSRMESMAESAIVSTFTCVLCQTSPAIFKSALRKLHTFITSRIFETTVSGKCIASILRTFAKIRPEETLKLFLPHICGMILSLAEHEDIKKEEKLDNELLYNLLLLSELVHCKGGALLAYGEMVEKVLDLMLHAKCCEAYTIASKMLTNILTTISTTRPLEFKSSNEDFGKPVSEYLPVRDWGKPFKCSDVEIEWFTPGAAEVAYTQHLIEKYLAPELETVRSYSIDKLNLTREELQCSLHVISAFLGCKRLLPLWEEPPVHFVDTCVERKNFYLKSAFPPSVTMPNKSNVRCAIASVLTRLQAKLFASAEDDTKSLNNIASIWGNLLLNHMPSIEEFESQTKALLLGKKMFENKLLGKRRHIRAMLVNQTYHQHEAIVLSSSFLPSATHVEIFHRLLELATSHYSEVRRTAQCRLNAVFKVYSQENILVPKLAEILKLDPNVHHEKFKGALFVLLGPKDNPLIQREKLSVVKELWPALVQAKPSEKPSVINLLNTISDTTHKMCTTLALHIEVGDKGEEDAKSLWENSSPKPDIAMPSADDIAAGKERLAKLNETRKADYLQVLDSLLKSIHSNLHWRHHSLALRFFRILANPDCHFPANVVKTILQTLVHDNIEFRKIAIKCTVFILRQQKREHKRRVISIDRSGDTKLRFGERDDNQWLQYKSTTVPRTQEAWDEPRYEHKPHVGYYSWEKEVKLYCASSEQPVLDRTRDQLTDTEKEVHDFFSDPQKISRLISFLSLEEKKGKDKFSGIHFALFKGLFRNHGDTYLELFKPHLERLIADKQESSQRCAAEIITGIIRGSKHWPYNKVEKMWDYLMPLLRSAFTNMTEETVTDWSILAATASEHRDPNRHHWLFEFLMDNPLRDGASFIDCGRLTALQGALNQQEWRVTELFVKLLDYLRPKLSHPYQLLRERIGSVLTNIFGTDLPTSGPRRTRGPLINEFVLSIIPQLNCLYSLSDVSANQPSGSNEAGGSQMETDLAVKGPSLNENEKNTAICLLKTMIKWITNSVVRADFSVIPEFFAFFPLVCFMESYEGDDELKQICSAMLAAMAQSVCLPEFVPSALAAIEEVSQMSSWWSRASSLEFLQVFVFHNMTTIASQEKWVSQVNILVLKLLKDERVEVREMAGQVLSGLIHCDFVGDRRRLMNDLIRMTTKKKKSSGNEISKRHAGVLGLCAFISANPYDVVEPVPEIFPLLGSHLNDPQPIPSSIRKTLGDFKRTHHDNWEQHKLKFTEEQLSVLTDLIVPPSYYA